MEATETLAELVRTRWRALVGYGFVLTGDLSEAEELTSEAVLRTFARRRRNVDLHAAEPYVRGVMLHLYVDGFRRRRRWFSLRPRIARPDRVEASDVVAGDRIDVGRALAALPRRERACVVLRYYDDLTVPRIAQELGIAQGSVKRYLSQALAKLEAALSPGHARPGAEEPTMTEGSR